MSYDLKILEKLQRALVVAKHRNFISAADELNISQPALSYSIKSLERYFDTLFFDRKSGKVLKITESGQHLLRQAESVIRAYAAFDRAMRHSKELQEYGGIAISIGEGIECYMGQIAATFMAEHPHVKLTMITSDFKDIEKRLDVNEIELFIGDYSDAINEDRFKITKIIDLHCNFYCRPGHPLFKERAIPELIDIVKYPIVLPRVSKRFHNSIYDDISTTANSRRTITCDNTTIIKHLLMNNEFIAVGAPENIESEVKAGDLAIISTTAIPYKLKIGMVESIDLFQSPQLMHFKSTVHSIFDKLETHVAPDIKAINN